MICAFTYIPHSFYHYLLQLNNYKFPQSMRYSAKHLKQIEQTSDLMRKRPNSSNSYLLKLMTSADELLFY